MQGIWWSICLHISPDLNPIAHKWAQAKKERVVAIQRFCSQSIWCNQN
ncbi:hypothetical protein [Symbiopectobacterium sp. RP]